MASPGRWQPFIQPAPYLKMKIAVIFVVVGITLLGLFLYPAIFRSDSNTVDIHLSDTYFVIHKFYLVIAVGLFSLTLFGFGGVIGTGFKNKMFLFTFFIALLLDGLVAWWIYNQLKGT